MLDTLIKCDILIVEDHEIHLDAIEDFYISKGLQVEKALSANIAEKKLKNIHPRMILMDLGLPDIPGEILCKKIKQNENYKDIRIILISAKDVENINQLVKEAKADDFIPKPISLKDLEEILKYLDDYKN